MEFFVIGPVGVQGLGLARRCLECRDRQAGDASRCNGFGSGCLLTAPAANDAAQSPQSPGSTTE